MKKIKIGINGFGRIGRQLTKLILDNNNLEIVAINDLSDSKTSAHLFKFDTSYGLYEKKVDYNQNEMRILSIIKTT